MVGGWNDEGGFEGANIGGDVSADGMGVCVGRIAEGRGDGAEEGVEIFGHELADVGGAREVAGGFGFGSPAAEEFEDGEEELVFGSG